MPLIGLLLRIESSTRVILIAQADRTSLMDARKIIHVDMDAFYASVEQRDDPQLRGLPVVVAWRGKRSVVCAASYEARKFGVRSAMPAVTAERLCPNAIFIPPDFTRYRAVSKSVREIFLRHTDWLSPFHWTKPISTSRKTRPAFQAQHRLPAPSVSRLERN